tara:strand:+ start:504 stop:1805 length:1302 start_codon:yes stop_codon:yes gene_type:complete
VKTERKSIINLLKKAKRPVIAEILEKIWDLSLSEYANSLWQNKINSSTIENELKEAFEKEFIRIGFGLHEAKFFSARLEKTKVIQTSTHLTASEGPTFLAIHHLALAGMPPEDTYFVGAYSGVPFSNSAWSGCLNYSNHFKLEEVIAMEYKEFSDLKRAEIDRSKDSPERRISLIPGNMRNRLVFQSKIPGKLVKQVPYFADPIKRLTPFAEKGNDFSVWATQFCTNQLRYLIRDKSIIYFDINEVIRSYLINVLKITDHPLHTMLFDSKIREKILRIFSPELPFFSIEIFCNNKFRHQSVTIKDGVLWSQNYRLDISVENIIQELEKGVLCPSLFIVFTTLCFLNGLICFGSFKQVEYLTDFKKKWLKNNLLEKEFVDSVNVSALTSGLCLDHSGRKIFPLDLILGLDWNLDKNITIADFIKPLLPRMGVFI